MSGTRGTRGDRWARGQVTLHLESGDRIVFRGGVRTISKADDREVAVDYEVETTEVVLQPRIDQLVGISVRK